jgi:hypothetical protein
VRSAHCGSDRGSAACRWIAAERRLVSWLRWAFCLDDGSEGKRAVWPKRAAHGDWTKRSEATQHGHFAADGTASMPRSIWVRPDSGPTSRIRRSDFVEDRVRDPRYGGLGPPMQSEARAIEASCRRRDPDRRLTCSGQDPSRIRSDYFFPGPCSGRASSTAASPPNSAGSHR